MKKRLSLSPVYDRSKLLAMFDWIKANISKYPVTISWIPD